DHGRVRPRGAARWHVAAPPGARVRAHGQGPRVLRREFAWVGRSGDPPQVLRRTRHQLLVIAAALNTEEKESGNGNRGKEIAARGTLSRRVGRVSTRARRTPEGGDRPAPADRGRGCATAGTSARRRGATRLHLRGVGCRQKRRATGPALRAVRGRQGHVIPL